MINHHEARKRVFDNISSSIGKLPADDEVMIVDDATIEKPWGWVFFYTSRKWLETKEFRYAIPGNSPLIVERSSGSIISTGTAHSIESYIAKYERYGSPHAEEIPEVRINGWHQGAPTVKAIQTVRDHSGLGLANAKEIIEACLANGFPTVVVGNVQIAKNLVATLGDLGFVAEILCKK